MLKQVRPKGTVRSTARQRRLRGLADSEDLAGVGEGLLDSPPGRITGHQILGR
jgi:hypothetical protein